MRIGVPKEIKVHEYRVGMTPAAAREAVEHGHQVPPERVVAVAQVGVPGAEERVGEQVQREVAGPAHRRDVGAAAPGDEARALGEVRAVEQHVHERGDLARIGRAVGVEHHDDVAAAGGEPAGERVALALAGLAHHVHVGAKPAGHLHGAVDGVAVDQDDLVDVARQAREHVRQVAGLVQGRNDHAHPRTGAGRVGGRLRACGEDAGTEQEVLSRAS